MNTPNIIRRAGIPLALAASTALVAHEVGGVEVPNSAIETVSSITPEGGAVGAYGIPSAVKYRRLAVGYAVSQLGVREHTGNNDGIPARRYSGGREIGWNSTFVSTVLRKAGQPVRGTRAEGVLPGHIVPSVRNLYKKLSRTPGVEIHTAKEVLKGDYKPRPADVVFYNLDNVTGPNIPEHVGILKRYNKKTKKVTTIDGNWNNQVSLNKGSLRPKKGLSVLYIANMTAPKHR